MEENSIRGGAGAGVAETLAQYERASALLMLGLPDKHIEQGDPAEVLAQCGLDATGIGEFGTSSTARKTCPFPPFCLDFLAHNPVPSSFMSKAEIALTQSTDGYSRRSE